MATHGLAKAIEYIDAIGFDAIQQHEQELTRYCIEQLQTIEGLVVYGPNVECRVENVEFATALETNAKGTAAANSTLYTLNSKRRDAVVSFNVGNIHHLDMGTLLDRLGIAVRTGHHCAQPLMDRLGISGTVRASFALYNTKEEIDALVAGIRRVSQMF